MKLELLDKNLNNIDDNKIYYDTDAYVGDIHIIHKGDTWYAQPDGLDCEKLEDISQRLVPEDQTIEQLEKDLKLQREINKTLFEVKNKLIKKIYDKETELLDIIKEKIDRCVELEKELKSTQGEMHELDQNNEDLRNYLFGEDNCVSSSDILEKVKELNSKSELRDAFEKSRTLY